MHVLLLYNPGAGSGDNDASSLARLIRKAGHEVQVESRKDNWTTSLSGATDLVAVAGGDGSVTQVARTMVDRPTPLAILPIGTANNLAHSVGISGEPKELIAGWDRGRVVPLDAATATYPWGRFTFFESAGFGLFAEAMCLAKSHAEGEDKFTPEERFDRDFRLLRRMADTLPAIPCSIEVDGTGMDDPALICEVMNTRQVGSRLVLAPKAETGDGLLDLVLVKEDQRSRLKTFLQREHSDDHLPHLPVVQGRRFHITSRMHRIHFDDAIHQFPAAGQPWVLDIEVHPGAVRVLVP